MRHRRFVTTLAAGLLAGLALVPQIAQGADAYRSSPNMKLVAQITGIGGSDIELFSRTLQTYKESDGSMVTPPASVERHFAFVGSYQAARIVDVTNPEQPYVVATMENCSVAQGDIQIRADGMLAAIGKQGSGTCRVPGGKTLGAGSAIVDISNVYQPTVIGLAEAAGGAHNVSLTPDGRYLYMSNCAPVCASQTHIPIFDLADPSKPVLVKNWAMTGSAPHDIRFSPDGKRAYMAGISTYRIVNTEDPRNPQIISEIVPPGGTIGHDNLVTPDKAFLFLGDEAGGGSPYPCPGGAIYAYDIRNEAAPIFLGMAEAGGGPVVGRAIDEVPPAGATVGACTSHVMELNPDKKSLTLGWYVLGSRTFSFASFYNADGTPKTAGAIAAAWGKFGIGLVETGWISPDSSETWAAKQYAKVPGYIFSNARGAGGGFYVTKITGPSY